MTIALGILSNDGIVIAADTQEGGGYPGSTKVSGYKIMSRIVRDQERAISATGAGWAGFIDSINQQLIDEFAAERAPMVAEANMRRRLRKFYDDHVLPQSVLPERERPQVDVIVGMTSATDGCMLLASAQSTLRRIYDQQYVAIGAGQEHASMLLARIFPRGHCTVELAILLAVYTVFHVKEYIEGCGKETHVTILQNGRAKYLSLPLISVLENRFREYLNFDALSVNYMLGRHVKDETEALNVLMRKLQSIRGTAKKIMDVKLTPASDLDWTSAESVALPEEGFEPVISFIDPPTPTAARRSPRAIR